LNRQRYYFFPEIEFSRSSFTYPEVNYNFTNPQKIFTNVPKVSYNLQEL
jgi:hypothetical protein